MTENLHGSSPEPRTERANPEHDLEHDAEHDLGHPLSPTDRAQMVTSTDGLFDGATLLGGELREELLSGVRVDTGDQRIADALERALRIRHARTASLMLVDQDCEHIRIAATLGMPQEKVSGIRLRLGEGVAGKALALRQPGAMQGLVPSRAEESDHPRQRIAASAPILVSGQAIGVLSVNAEAPEEIQDQNLLIPLARLARELAPALIEAIDLSELTGAARRPALHMQADRLMSLDAPIPVRLQSVTEILRKATGADCAHLLLLDPVGERLESPASLPGPVPLAQAGSLPVGRGFFGWVMRHGKPQVLEAFDEVSGERIGLLCYPIRGTHSQGLIVLEAVRLDEVSRSELLDMIEEVIGQVEGVIGIEEDVAMQELVCEFKMRIADQNVELEDLAPNERISSLLEFTLNLVAAEAAVWVPGKGQPPILTHPLSRQAELIVAWGEFDDLAKWTREKGAEAGGVIAGRWDPGAPVGPAPYAGVPAPGGEGALLVFFPPGENAGAPSQVPAHVLWQALGQVAELIVGEQDFMKMETSGSGGDGGSDSGGDGGSDGASTTALESSDADELFSARALSKLIERERRHSEHHGDAFALTRFELAGTSGDNQSDSALLRSFLLRLKDERDLLSEIRPGVFVILTPEVTDDAEASARSLAERWRAEQPWKRLEMDLRICPRDGQAEEIMAAWSTGDDAASRAA